MFRSNARKVAEERSEAPVDAVFFAFMDVVDSALQHPVEVEQLLAGQARHCDIEDQRHYFDHKKEFVTVYRALDWVHIPLDVRMQRIRSVPEVIVNDIHQSVSVEERVNDTGPAPLNSERNKGEYHTGNQTDPGSLKGSETAVKAEDHHRSAAAEIHRKDYGSEEFYVVDLREHQRAENKYASDPDRGPAQEVDMSLRRRHFLQERQDHVLDERLRGAEYVTIVG